MRRPATVLASIGVVLLSGMPLAYGQFGFYQLPNNDFRWNWGKVAAEGESRGMADIEVSGSESFFSCDLTARMRISSPLTPEEIREIEFDLRARLDFIYAVSETMNYLEQMRTLDWAVLDCKKQQREESSPEESAARQDEARAKMLRELERRRARQQRDN